MLYSDKNEQKWNACWELSLIETRLLNCSKIPADVRGTQSFQFHDKWRYGFWVIAYLVTEAMWKYLFTCADNNNNKALYLYPIHAGLHLQLLHSFPGLGDAGRAVVGDAVLHGAPVTPNRCKGGGGDSVNVTLNQHPPWRQLYPDGAATLLQPHPHPFLFTQWNLEGPILFVHLLSEEAALWASAGQRFVIFQPALMHDCFSSFVTLLFRPTGGGGG